ncbi:MAG: maleylpyruvate isomerase N-terminal domain-containing protein [Pseudonocardiales bacterium]|nr:maleylpyruvate isomerase N-terminal domain-containing protein [Pseudonocardiales bacterium]
MTQAPMETLALMETLAGADPAARTACPGWTVHELVAHLAAGAKENADLIEDVLAGRPTRATRSFDEREAVFVAMPDEQLRDELARESTRKLAAVDALAARGPDATYDFTGRKFTAAIARMHGHSEAALHRWDIVGDDEVGETLLVAPELTRHAVEVLNTLPILYEAPAPRARAAGVSRLRVVLRSPAEPDVVLAITPDGARFELRDVGDTAEGDAVLTTDTAHRLLAIWGRGTPQHPVTIAADPRLWATVAAVLWGSAS